MELNVDLDKEAVEKQVVEAIMASAIGAKIEDAIKGALAKETHYGAGTVLENAVKSVVRDQVRTAVADMLNADATFRSKVRKAAAEYLTDEALQVLIATLFKGV